MRLYYIPFKKSCLVMKLKLKQQQHHQRRCSLRTSVNLSAGILLPILFIRTAFLALDASAICPPISCLGWRLAPRLFGTGDASLELGRELRKAYVVDGGGRLDPTVVEAAPDSLDDLMAEIGSASSSTAQHGQHLDIQTFVMKTQAMLMKMERKVKLARLQASIYMYLASIGIPKSMHCLTLKLAEDYLINSLARSSLPSPEYSSILTNASYIHLVLLTDNVLAAAVAVSSTITSSINPDKIVFHIITDRKTYNAMHTWFALHSTYPAIVEVKGLHQFDWPTHVHSMIMETAAEIHQDSLEHHKYSRVDEDYRHFESLKPSSFSLLNYVKIHLPELFPKLERVIFLDDDVVVRRDLTALWNLNLSGNANGAVSVGGGNNGRERNCIGKRIGDYLNFSDPLISSPSLGLEGDQCAWLGGVNVFDLKVWRRTNITKAYQHWLNLNRESGFALWHLGWLPPALIAFNGQVHPIDPSWHLSGLGTRMPEPELLESAAVLHFSGPRKPWLEIGFPELQKIWQSHINQSDEFIRSCRVIE